MIRISRKYLVSLPSELSEWLDSHREYRPSGLFEKAVSEAKKNEEEMVRLLRSEVPQEAH